MMSSHSGRVVALEPAAKAFAEANNSPPYLFELGPEQGRAALDATQSGTTSRPDAEIHDLTVPDGPHGDVAVRIVKPVGVGDSVGGNLAAALTLLAKQRSGPAFAAQVLFYPVTNASFDTRSYHRFAEGYHLRRDAMMWYWDQYSTETQRAEITASPLRATTEQVTGLPPALVVTAQAVQFLTNALTGDRPPMTNGRLRPSDA